MAFSKAKLYEIEDQITSEYFRALNHPARLLIIRKLCKTGPCTVHQLLKQHPISKSTMSDHLEILRNAQLVTYKEKYPYIIYYMHRKKLADAEKRLNSYFQHLR